ncbi:DnaB-like helicase N-terminal domain-containing protein [uncultured Cellulomonas sp.]|uniref:DnaB-like helicase N-terminal domain-containing protein n=1 Tax=uncultured Cellulomonas sp. TaxID=189682 RepID=UPI0028E7266D|nr:DnaB-like helicase N-terminal domain-containing protein [uncultured Cellulomonas sp.]
MNDDDIIRLAEQATLGSVLLQPTALDDIQRWLRAGDFADTWHSEVFTTMLERHAAHEPIDPQRMADALTERLGTRRANLPRLADLLHVTPPHPHAVTYARMVLDGGLRREIAGAGVLLRAAAVRCASDRMSRPIFATCNVVDAAMDCAEARWAKATGQPHDEVVVPLALRAVMRNTEARMGADKYLSAHPGRDAGSERRNVIALIGALIAQPDHVPEVAKWLAPARITDPGWRAVYGTLVELAELGQHIDIVTVAWATRAHAHAHAHHQPGLPGLSQLRAAVDDGWSRQLRPAIQAVAGDQVRHLADAGAAQLVAGATNPGVLITDLVDTGHLLTSALRRTAAALPIEPAHSAAAAPVVRTQQIESVSR